MRSDLGDMQRKSGRKSGKKSLKKSWRKTNVKFFQVLDMIVLLYLENHELLYIHRVIVETLKKPKDPISLDVVSGSFKKIEIVFIPSS